VVTGGKAMFIFRKRKGRTGGGKYTFISIILIVIAVYVFRMVSPQVETEYPVTIHYDGQRYSYSETIKSWPFAYARKRPVCEEGYIVLARRGVSVQEEVYIYEGNSRYRRYVAVKE
jgi:hypothetical protein